MKESDVPMYGMYQRGAGIFVRIAEDRAVWVGNANDSTGAASCPINGRYMSDISDSDVKLLATMLHHGKIANDKDEAWKMQELFSHQAVSWIQWKGTDVCMDIHCKCGHHSHLDDSFAYHVKCPKCGTVYMCNGHIELIELKVEPEHCVKTPELGDDDDA